MKANINVLLPMMAVLTVFFMLMPVSLAETVYIHGYVKYDNTPVNGITVSLAGGFPGSRSTVTSSNGSNAGYYQFAIENGSGSGYTIFTGYNGCNLTNNFWVPKSNNDVDVPKDLAIPRATPTPTPTPSPTATPTPRPSGELGGTVIRNDSSSFIPVPISSPSTAPTLKPLMPPTATPTPEPTSTPEPSASAPSNVYLWLVIALVAIVAIAAAALLYLRK